MDRKTFFQSILTAAAAGTLLTYIESCNTNSNTSAPSANFTLDLTQSANSALKSNGGAVISNNVIVINNNGKYVALSDICTHQGCSVSYDPSSKQLFCPCHGGTYNLTGAVTGGPPPAPLMVYTVTQSGQILTIKG